MYSFLRSRFFCFFPTGILPHELVGNYLNRPG
jgi:hypothetical protein